MKKKQPIEAADKTYFPYDDPNVEINFPIPESLQRAINRLEESIRNDRWDIIDMNKGGFDVDCKHLCYLGIITPEQLELLRRRYLI